MASILLSAAFLIGRTPVDIAMLVLSVFIVIMSEFLNTTIEAIVDKVSPDSHSLAGAAKDCGSAAVFFSLLSVVAVWGVIIGSYYI